MRLGSDRGSAPSDRFEDVLALGKPSPTLVGSMRPEVGPDELRRRSFVVRGRELCLPVPIDWRHDSEGRSWRFQLQTLTWLRPAVARYADAGDVEALEVVQEIVLDWARQHSSSNPELSEFAWYDMAVGLRGPYLAYTLRAGLSEGTLDEPRASLLLEAAERHGHELADPANYSAGNNHGLFQDEGLYLLAKQLPTMAQASEWTALSRRRLMKTLRETVDFEEGAHLEHSTGYQFAIHNLVTRISRNTAMPETELEDLLPRLGRTAMLHVTPSGNLVQLGDTDDVSAPRWAADGAREIHGLSHRFAAGQAFVRDGDSYLAVTAGHHHRAHKHADDTSFVLFEDGRAILGDTGRWGYYEDEPDRLYARSNRAHNVLVVDGRDLPWLEAEPYGSGLVAAGSGDGWYAILTANLLLRRQRVHHRRLILYRPGAVLVVADEVKSWRKHEYTRYWHLGRDMRATAREGGIAFTDGTVTGALMDSDPEIAVELVSGRDEPTRLGWSYPADRQRIPVCTATFRTRGRSRLDTGCLTLGDAPLTARTTPTDDGYAVSLSDGRTVTVSRTDAQGLTCREAELA